MYTDATTCGENPVCKVTEQGERCIPTPTETNWDKEIVVKRKWYDKTLFELFDGKLRVTSGMAIGVVIAIIVVALIVSACMSYIAYKNKEKIGEEMRRLSTKVRASFKGKQPDAPTDPNHPDNKDRPVNAAQRDILQAQRAAGDVELAADKDKDMGEEEHKFDGDAPAAAQADIDGKNEVANNIYQNEDDENIRGTVAPGGSASQKPAE